MQDMHMEKAASSIEDGDTPLASAPGSHLSLLEALKIWRFGIGWSVILSFAVISAFRPSTCRFTILSDLLFAGPRTLLPDLLSAVPNQLLDLVVESYDTILLNSLYAAPAFQRQFGVRQHNGKYLIPAAWQSALGSGTTAALIIGIFLGAPLIDRFGSRKCMIGGLIWNFAFGFLIFFSKNLHHLLAGNVLCACLSHVLMRSDRAILIHDEHIGGLPWGLFAVTAVAYAVEVVPTQLRNYMSSYGKSRRSHASSATVFERLMLEPSTVNLCWVMGEPAYCPGSSVLRLTILPAVPFRSPRRCRSAQSFGPIQYGMDL